MSVAIRPMREEDVETCGRICYEAFRDVAERHHFRPDFPTPESATQVLHMFFSNPHVFAVVAESGGRVVGSNFLSEYDAVRAVGPVTVDPSAQAKGAGRRLMEAVIERGRGAPSVRLVQDTYNAASLSLYASLGFDVREPLALLEGEIKDAAPEGVEVRPLRDEDVDACAELCERVHGFARAGELRNRPPFLTSYVAAREGRIVAYASAPHFWPLNHAVAETDDDLRALLAGAFRQGGGQPLTFILPMRRADLFRWCLGGGLRVVKTMTLMTTGVYHEPRGAYLPSVGY